MAESNSHLLMSEPDPGYGQLLAVLVRRRWWVIGILGATVLISGVFTLFSKSTYRSSMQLMIESNYRSRKTDTGTTGTPSFADSNVEIDNATQLNLMRSSQLLQRAVDQLEPRYRDIEVDQLKNNLTVSQVLEQKGNDKIGTSIFEIVYIDSDRQKTQDVLQAIQQVYQQYNLEQQKLRLTKGLSFINDQIPQVEARVNTAEAELEKFRKKQDLIDPELQSKSLVEALSSLQKDQRLNRADLKDLQARYGALQQQLARSPQQAAIAARLSQSPRYQSLLNEIQKSEIAIVKERTRFKDKAPFVQQVIDQRQKQLALLRQEVQRILGPQTAALAPSADGLVAAGQLGENDLKFASSLVEAQVNLVAAQARDRSLTDNEAQLRAELKRFPSLLAEYNRLQPNVLVNRETLQQLLKARQELGLEIARGGFDWQLVEPPQLGRKTGPSWLRNLLLGSVAGLMLGSVAAFLRDAADDAVRTSEDLKKQVAFPLLGLVPEVPLNEIAPFQKSPSLAPSPLEVIHWAPFRESLDLIYKNIQLLTIASPLKSIVITSALAGEGKSTIALGLAISAARLHQRVLLIDADLRRPGLHKQLELPNEQGLSNLLSSDRALSQNAIQPASTYSDLSISVLTAGPAPTDPVKLLSSRRMRELMLMFEQSYDLVIVDSPPALGIVDAMLAASFCDGALFVGRIGQVSRNEVTQAAAAMSRLNVIGIVANGAQNTSNAYYRSATTV
ncbi:GumC family protein [Phormidesmis sp. 146-12]